MFLIGLLLVFLFQLITGLERLVVTEDFFIYTYLFTKKKFAKSDYQIVGTGAKQKDYYGYGENSSNTEYWRQLNIVHKETLKEFEIQVKSSHRYYQKIVSYLKLAEMENYLPAKPQPEDEVYTFIPLGKDQYSKLWQENLFILLIGTVLTFFVYVMIPIEIFDIKWQLLMIVGIFFVGGARNISFKKKIIVQQIDIQKDLIVINGVRFKDDKVLRFSMSASHDGSQKNDAQLLELVFDDSGRKRRLSYHFNLNRSQLAEYRRFEEKLLQKYGRKYQFLYSRTWRSV